MHLIQILLPLHDNQSRLFPPAVYDRVRDELTQRFGGLTAYSRAPAEGLWRPADEQTNQDQIIVYEVMTSRVDAAWWADYRKRLEAEFRQQQIVVRATQIEVL